MSPLSVLENPIVNGVVKIFLVVYTAAILPELPNYVKKFFKNPVLKLFVLFLMTYVGIKDPVMSLMIGIAFTLTMLALNKLETISDVHDILDSVVDVPQQVLNDLIDGTQEIVSETAGVVDRLTEKAGIKVAGPVAKVANKVVDGVQGVGNDLIDGAQKVVSGIVGTIIPKQASQDVAEVEAEPVEEPAKESFSMSNPESNVNFEMGSLGNISGADSEPAEATL